MRGGSSGFRLLVFGRWRASGSQIKTMTTRQKSVVKNAQKPRWRNRWSIAMYEGESPLNLTPLGGRKGPALSPDDISGMKCTTVADPFFLRDQGDWWLFFEAFNGERGLGELAVARSLNEGLDWRYECVVLAEPFHLSYPQVIPCDGSFFMIPETRQTDSVRLYRSDSPVGPWQHVKTLLTGSFADATVLFHDERWWLFAQKGLDELRVYYSDSLEGPWSEHPQSPFWPGNRSRTRPGGRFLRWQGRLFRFAQDGWPSYGSQVRAYEITALNLHEYSEFEVPESPILKGSGKGWNALGMHHIDAVELEGGKWLAAVDGTSMALGSSIQLL